MREKSLQLKRIFVEHGNIWEILPEEHFGLAGNLNLDVNLMVEGRRELFGSLKGKLKLSIYGRDCSTTEQAVIVQFLKSCRESLEELIIRDKCFPTITTFLSRV